MNRSRSIRRSNRKKAAVPLYFQKNSNSQFLAAANYKLQIKKLKKTNKELACSLQEVKCRAADQERALAGFNQEGTQSMFVKMKIKDIVATVEKLVTDLGDVYDAIDGKSFNFLKNCSATHQAGRLQICNPSLSLVEESASMSTIEPDLSKEENLCPENLTRSPRIESGSTTPIFDADSSQTEVYNVPLILASEQRGVSTGRSSKSLERTGSSTPDLDATPQPPIINWPIKRQSSMEASKRGSITCQTPVKTADLPQMQPITSTSAVKTASKSTISKIPVKKPAVSTENFPRLAAPSMDIFRRKTFVVEKNLEDPLAPLPVNEETDKIVLNTLADNTTSGTIFDRRGTFVLNSLADLTKQDTAGDRRVTYFVPTESKEQQNETKPDTIIDRRGTYFIPAKPKEQEGTSPPKVIETDIPIPNAVPNQTIYLCEDMELTEILPFQKQQSPQLIPPWNEKLEVKEPVLDEKLLASDKNQPSCTTSLVEQFSISNINENINSSKQTEVGVIHDNKDAQIQTTENKVLVPSNLSMIKSLAEASVSDLNPTNPQLETYKEKNIEKKELKKDDKNVKRSAKELPSPISHCSNHDMSIQNKIFESFSAIEVKSNKNNTTFDSTSAVKGDGHKESTDSKGSLSANQPAVELMTVKKDAESPKIVRKSGRNQKKSTVYFSSSEESDLDLDIDFVPPKRSSIKLGRRIINPNNKKVFVFKTASKKQPTNKDTLTDSPPNETVEENIKNDPGNDVFNFSSSSDASKSPVMKNKKRKSLMPKSNKRSVSKKSEGKILSKTSRSSKPEINNDQVSVATLSRRSILSLKKDNSPSSLKAFNRKSVRFSVVKAGLSDEINIPKCDSPCEEKISSVNQESDNIIDVETLSSGSNQDSQDKGLNIKKRYSLVRTNSFTTTGDILKSSSGKTKRSRKRQTSNSNSDCLENVCESDCSPKKKMCQVSSETLPKSTETHLNAGQEQSKDAIDGFGQSQGLSIAVPSEVLEKNPTVKETEKNPILPNLHENVKVTGSTDEAEKTDNKVKRPFSGVSERRSNKKQSLVDDIFVPEGKLSRGKKEKKSSRAFSKLSQNLEANVKVVGSADEAEKTDNKVKRPFSGVSERRSNKKQSIVDDDLFPSEAHEEKSADSKKEKYSGRILSELPQNSDANVKIIRSVDKIEETNTYKAKRPHSEVSKNTSNKKQPIGNDGFPSTDDAICEMNDMKTSFKLVEDEPTEIYHGNEMIKSVETDYNKDTLNIKKVEKNKGSRKKRNSNKKKTPKQSKSKENIPNEALKNIKLDVLSDCNLDALSDEYVGKLVKPKISRKKKESAPLLQHDLKVDVLNSANAISSDEAVGGRSRRRKEVDYKGPGLRCKLRRE